MGSQGACSLVDYCFSLSLPHWFCFLLQFSSFAQVASAVVSGQQAAWLLEHQDHRQGSFSHITSSFFMCSCTLAAAQVNCCFCSLPLGQVHFGYCIFLHWPQLDCCFCFPFSLLLRLIVFHCLPPPSDCLDQPFPRPD